MTIRSRLQLFSIFSVAVMLIMAIMLYSSYREFQKADRRLRRGDRIQVLVVERALLRDEIIFTNSTNSMDLWQKKSGQLNRTACRAARRPTALR